MKKTSVIAFVLLALFVVGTVYALVDEPGISGRNTNTLTVSNPNPRPPSKNPDAGRLKGEICVYYTDAESEPRQTSIDFNLKGGESKRYSIPGKITGWGTLYCSVLEGYYDN
jgi:hypothetical protein